MTEIIIYGDNGYLFAVYAELRIDCLKRFTPYRAKIEKVNFHSSAFRIIHSTQSN